MGCLYQIEFPNGKKYIGISKHSAEKRFAGHKKDSKDGKLIVHNAIRKCGKENCKVVTLVVANDIEYLKDLEIKAIAAFNTKYPNGYNCTKGGDGVDFTDDLRKRISNSRKDWWKNKDNRISLLAKLNSKEVKDKQRAARADRIKSEEYLKRLPEIKRKMSLSSNKRWESISSREKSSDNMSKRWKDPEFRDMMKKKFSEARKKQWQDPEYREATLKKIAMAKSKRGASDAIQ